MFSGSDRVPGIVGAVNALPRISCIYIYRVPLLFDPPHEGMFGKGIPYSVS